MADVGTNPLDLALLVAAGQFDESVLDALQRGFATFINRDGGNLTLERCLRLPTSAKRFREAQRDLWLARVVGATEGTSLWARYVAASATLDAFLSRGPWRAWRDLKDPPAGTSSLRVALFYTAKFNDGEGLAPKTVGRRIGHIFQ